MSESGLPAESTTEGEAVPLPSLAFKDRVSPDNPTFFKLLKNSIRRHLTMRSYEPYERLLSHLRERGDIWMVSQGEFLDWWLQRERATLRVVRAEGKVRAETDLEGAVIEKFPGEFLDSEQVAYETDRPDGELVVTIDETLPRKELLVEVLKQEGILNFRYGTQGEVFLGTELSPLLEEIEQKLEGVDGHLLLGDTARVRQRVVEQLAGAPLLRVWYHPRVDGRVMRAVFSPRFDVDRAITNLQRIRELEQRYGTTSTLYVRAFCPFYSRRRVKSLARKDWCSEIGLHGEFVRNAAVYGDEVRAAQAERAEVEALTGRPIRGVCMHGGEGMGRGKCTEHTTTASDRAGFLYDTTTARPAFFPSRRLVGGVLGSTFALGHTFCDIYAAPDERYAKEFYEGSLEAMDRIYAQNGVFILQLHPVYFGFLRYLLHPINWWPLGTFLVSFSWSKLRARWGQQVMKPESNQ